MCREAPKEVIELKNYGLPFLQTEDGKIYQANCKLHIGITRQFKQTSKVVTRPLVGVSTTKSNFKEDTKKFNFLTHAYDTKE